MPASYHFPANRSPDQDAPSPVRHPVVIIGAGPVGLSLAIDLARRGTRVVLLDDSDRIGEGSRAICFAKKTLEIFARLGCVEPILDKGVRWSVGRVFRGDAPLYHFDLLAEGGHRMPAFVNIQQYYVEKHLVDRALPLVDIRWRNRVTGVSNDADHVRVEIATPDGPYVIKADYVVACDGARSPVRSMLGLDFHGEVFDDQFLIADVKMLADFPVERWFWFDPPFHAGQSALLHKQPDDIWRIDLQLGRDADAEAEKQPENVFPRIRQMLGHDDFSLEWVSVYRFQCRRLATFVHERVIFAGDAAHQVSPFGARGANSGVQDAENLGWKLALLLRGEAGQALLDSYSAERGLAADDNILHSTRATEFLAPPTPVERLLRDAVLDLAAHAPFAQRMINSGRLSVPSAYGAGGLCMPDTDNWHAGVPPGAPVPDAPLATDAGDVWLSDSLGCDFTLLARDLEPGKLPADVRLIAFGDGLPFRDTHGLLERRFCLPAGGATLVRPDGHIAARTAAFSSDWLVRALARARGYGDG
ncbi:MAG: FAD-dependent oxidoreductase [Beijerinckiaceae bacterium]